LERENNIELNGYIALAKKRNVSVFAIYSRARAQKEFPGWIIDLYYRASKDQHHLPSYQALQIAEQVDSRLKELLVAGDVSVVWLTRGPASIPSIDSNSFIPYEAICINKFLGNYDLYMPAHSF
jgi:hypothetical protein